ncbi:neurturin [Sebastes umbrosus]|uniref:neurturin n=1 Tax=Sebastes umbrosus TaxID=72105 RepID=UPI00189F0AE2|nr:neurturin [Sebastes umbrosus]
MIGRASTLRKDGKTWWRQEASTPQHHLKNWKVMLWVVASLLTLVEDVFSEEDNKEAQSDLERVLSQPSVSPAENLEQDSRVHTPWHKALEEWSLMQEEEIQQGRWRRSPRDPNSPRTTRRNRKKTKSTHDCHLERKEMRVRDLGLGYDSDEIILFKYCVGTCHSSRRNYDLALKAVMDNGSISGKKISSHPCCRPTRYETVSFMDTQTTWQTIKWLSAANCSCVG